MPILQAKKSSEAHAELAMTNLYMMEYVEENKNECRTLAWITDRNRCRFYHQLHSAGLASTQLPKFWSAAMKVLTEGLQVPVLFPCKDLLFLTSSHDS